jgi:non-specific serine/threonine protein kinase
VPGAEISTLAQLAPYEAALLFSDRAASVVPSFRVTEENAADVGWVCRQLDGLPLAIELAAARVRTLSVGQIAERLRRRLPTLAGGIRTAPERQQTLRATIDWSYELCSPGEQLVWQRAAAFSGSFELDAAELVCGGSGVEPADVLDLLDGLIDKSVLTRSEQDGVVLFRMLETLREYGQERLEQADDWLRVATLHGAWCANLMLRCGAEWLCAEQVGWVNAVRRNLANLRVGADLALSEPLTAVVLVRIGYLTYNLWPLLGLVAEAQSWVERALPYVAPDTREYGMVRWAIGLAAVARSDDTVAATQLADAGEFAECTGDEVLAAQVDQVRGMACLFGGDFAQAVELLSRGLPTLRAHRMLESELMNQWLLGWVQGLSGDAATARVTLRDGLARSEQCGEIYFRGWMLEALQEVEAADGRLDAAEAAGLRALRLESEIGNLQALAATTSSLAHLAVRRDRLPRAATLFGTAATLWSATGSTPERYPFYGVNHNAYLAQATTRFGKARFDKAYAEGRVMSRQVAIEYALGEDNTPVAAPADAPVLTKRETEVAVLVAEGLTNREIAAKLFIAPRTAETHVEHILTKLGFSNRAQVASWVTTRDSPP